MGPGYLTRHYKIDILALFETHIFGAQAQAACDGMDLSRSIRVEAMGFGGGVWLLWNEGCCNYHDPCLIGGDFNCILHDWEKRGGARSLSPNSTVGLGSLIWALWGVRTLRPGKTPYWAKLMRGLIGLSKKGWWPEARVCHLAKFNSDHTPLLVKLDHRLDFDRARRPFRFEAAWTTHPHFSQFVKESWNGSSPIVEALDEFKQRVMH
ncbi:hypothetical protein V2J09_004299 [Rumex salicifolius]